MRESAFRTLNLALAPLLKCVSRVSYLVNKYWECRRSDAPALFFYTDLMYFCKNKPLFQK